MGKSKQIKSWPEVVGTQVRAIQNLHNLLSLSASVLLLLLLITVNTVKAHGVAILQMTGADTTISCQVTNSLTGKAIAGVSVTVKRAGREAAVAGPGTGPGTVTDNKGQFRLLAAPGDILCVVLLG